MKHITILFLLLIILLNNPLWTQDETNPGDEEDIDSLFEETNENEGEKENGGKTGEEEIDLLNDIKKEDFTFGAKFNFYFGYSPGWNILIWKMDDASNSDYYDSAVMMMTSNISLDFRISPEFRVFQDYFFKFPNFDILVNEFFCDYMLLDSVFLRLGRQKLTWGISRNFPFTNLPSRVPDTILIPSGDTEVEMAFSDPADPDSYSVKINIPMGVGGVDGLAFTRQSYFVKDPDLPSMNEIGYGGNFNLAVESFDFTIGTYYHEYLHYRTYCSLSFTLFDKLEIYTEGLIAFDLNPESGAEPADNEVDKSVNIGFYLDFFSGNLELNGEYFYNGEESELNIHGFPFPLFHGHNIAANISFKTLKKKLRLFAQYKYYEEDDSHLLIPGMTLDILPHFRILCTMPVVLGSEQGGYYIENPANLDGQARPISFVLALQLHGKK